MAKTQPDEGEQLEQTSLDGRRPGSAGGPTTARSEDFVLHQDLVFRVRRPRRAAEGEKGDGSGTAR